MELHIEIFSAYVKLYMLELVLPYMRYSAVLGVIPYKTIKLGFPLGILMSVEAFHHASWYAPRLYLGVDSKEVRGSSTLVAHVRQRLPLATGYATVSSDDVWTGTMRWSRIMGHDD